jgi:hypothetical protein
MVETIESDSVGWTLDEQEIARNAFDLAYGREVDALINSLRYRAQSISSVDGVWELHDFLSNKRYEIDGKYDYRYNSLLFVFASLVKDGLLNVDELNGLAAEKLAKIKAMARM